MKRCKFCGECIQDEDLFCQFCGKDQSIQKKKYGSMLAAGWIVSIVIGILAIFAGIGLSHSIFPSSLFPIVGLIFIAAAGLFLYFLPSIVGRHKINAEAIFVLNFFLGWTLIGWVAALVWAVAKDKS